MAEYIDREAFIKEKRKQYCDDCDRRKGMKNGKYKTLYDIGEAPCRSCGIGDVLDDVEDYPAADVREVVRGKWIEEPGHIPHCSNCGRYSDDADTGDAICCPFCGAEMKGEEDGT